MRPESFKGLQPTRLSRSSDTNGSLKLIIKLIDNNLTSTKWPMDTKY